MSTARESCDTVNCRPTSFAVCTQPTSYNHHPKGPDMNLQGTTITLTESEYRYIIHHCSNPIVNEMVMGAQHIPHFRQIKLCCEHKAKMLFDLMQNAGWTTCEVTTEVLKDEFSDKVSFCIEAIERHEYYRDTAIASHDYAVRARLINGNTARILAVGPEDVRIYMPKSACENGCVVFDAFTGEKI